MGVCSKCGVQNDAVSEFCQNCGTSMRVISHVSPSQKDVMSKVEESVYFRFSRAFAWFLLVGAIIGFIGSLIFVAPSVMDLIGDSKKVSVDEIRQLAEEYNTGKSRGTKGMDGEAVDREAMADLEKEIIDLGGMLPQLEKQLGRERFREGVLNTLGRWDDMRERIAVIREGKGVIKDFPDTPDAAGRNRAWGVFVQLKAQKEDAIMQKKLAAKSNILWLGGAALSTAMLIMLISMFLVGLAIERNTRNTRGQ